MRFGRKSLAAVSVVAIGAAVGAANFVPMQGTPAATAKLNALALLQARSPGERANGALANKGAPIHSASLSEAEAPPAGLLAPARSAAAPSAVTAVAAPAGGIIPVAAVAAPALVGVPATALAPAIPAAVVGAGVPVAALVGIGGAAAVVPAIFSGGGGDGATALVPTSGPEAPEPGTWLMMMVGFGVLGASLRRRRRRARQQGAASSAGRAYAQAS